MDLYFRRKRVIFHDFSLMNCIFIIYLNRVNLCGLLNLVYVERQCYRFIMIVVLNLINFSVFDISRTIGLDLCFYAIVNDITFLLKP